MITAYLLTGSNMGQPQQMLNLVVQFIEKELIGKIIRSSALYQTQAWGRHDQPDFLNQVLQIVTDLSAQQLLERLLAIETRLGRQRSRKNDPRIIDIDILFYGAEIMNEPNLIVPHPLLHVRRFVLAPLQEIAPDLIHPVLKKTVNELLIECTDPLHVHKFPVAR